MLVTILKAFAFVILLGITVGLVRSPAEKDIKILKDNRICAEKIILKENQGS